MKILILESDESRWNKFNLLPFNTTIVVTSQEAICFLQSAQINNFKYSAICIGEEIEENGLTLAEYIRLVNYPSKLYCHSHVSSRAREIRRILPKTFYMPYCDEYQKFIIKAIRARKK